MEGKHSFSDYGFVRIEPTDSGAELYRDDGSWMMGFEILSISPESIQLCFFDRAQMTEGAIIRPSYDTRSALEVTRSKGEFWSARQVADGFSECSNDPPMTN